MTEIHNEPIQNLSAARVAEDLSDAQKRTALFAALARARGEIRPVEKDGQTEGRQQYRFASAQAILESGRPAMAKHGLSIFPTDRRFVETEMMLYTEYLLTHEAGAEMVLNNMTPVVITEYSSGSRTARDKALGAARTVDLRYMYRDLLGIPQVDPEEEEHGRPEGHGEVYRRGGQSAERQEDPRRQPNDRQQAKKEEPKSEKPAQQPAATNEDVEARKTWLKTTIKDCREELGAELCAQLGLDQNPAKLGEAEALAKKLQDAVAKKREKAAAAKPPEPPKEEPKPVDAIDWT